MRIRRALTVLLLLAAGGCATSTPEEEPGGGLDITGGVTVDQALHDRLPQAVRARGSIRLVTDASYAPMEYYAADGRTIIGFSPDLATALGGVLGVRGEMVAGEFNGALDEVAAGEYDGVLSSMTDTAERQTEADFVNYLSTGTSIVVQRGNPEKITSFEDLCGHTVGTERGTLQEEMLQRLQPTCESRPLVIDSEPTNADALLLLRTGRVSAVPVDFPPAAFLVSNERTGAFYQLASDAQYEPGLFGIAVAKDNTALRDCLREALQRLIDSGVYADLLSRWNLASSAVTTATINGE
ncbi:putative ABC transporter substrate-binding protein [Actinoplanes missouriensis 431]|uniref:Putative ABC transporter substrate-binding protein n=1 Tax=Actinoplanes missouriensis (strain ATCC 14538 / DSM 43046 / CBS 188.64 / JCM 3121 / NBRC 102363 / NCIMB 12654 / NRRL B-3342 / UNCC 431) TaxID=512565 RepID=I0GY55_ACTM4|nr:ABC transporter substrate-binding protein [Actinoplanes missouriensis]BAL85692.1 putative ABC transporter substrate-binding protein [Actinoplanes missouriensis 431]